jgi:hypothetical protein
LRLESLEAGKPESGEAGKPGSVEAIKLERRRGLQG